MIGPTAFDKLSLMERALSMFDHSIITSSAQNVMIKPMVIEASPTHPRIFIKDIVDPSYPDALTNVVNPKR